jgi:hypothetical protein
MLLTATLGVLGVASGALAARVAEWQVVLIPMSIVSLALAHYFAYRRGVGGHRQRVLLWIATPVSLTLWVLPYLIR